MHKTLITAAAALGLFALTATALAGPPLICHPVDIGDAESLPWGSNAFDKKRGYGLDRLAGDTVAVLEKYDSALVHMETLRRAALYAQRDDDVATTLLATLMARALDAEASGEPDALTWLDAGYLAQCYHQLRVNSSGLECGAAEGVIGYGWVRRALELRADDPELEFAAAMMTALAHIPQHEAHVQRVRSLSKEDSLVHRNLEVHATQFWPHHRARARG